MNDEIIAMIKRDIERCENHTDRNGSEKLFQALAGKYNSLFPGFMQDIPLNGKVASGIGEYDFRNELNAIKEKLKMKLLIAEGSDPLHSFKSMFKEDLERLKKFAEDKDGRFPESEKQLLYKEVTAKYYPYVPKLGDGLYEFTADLGFFDEVSGSSLDHNIAQLYFKMITYQSLGFPGLIEKAKADSGPIINLTTKNENHNRNEIQSNIEFSFDAVREQVEGMTSLPYEDMEDILTKINELEEIIKSQDSKGKKWSRAKGIIKWIADKGVDVGIAMLPLLLNIR